jgi:beta-lactamase superfamily II metal-dependent hydrolase
MVKMSSPRSEPSESLVPSKSDEISVSIRVFECGQGDTILVNLPGGKWALIDCHLPEGLIRERFFKLIDEELKIKTIDFLCLTHPDLDHYHGMLEVIEHFTTPGRSIRFYCDSGIDPKQVRAILREAKKPEGEITEYSQLHTRLDELFHSNTISYLPMHENSRALPVGPHRREVQLIPIGPDPAVVRRMTRAAIASGRVSRSVNAISLVLLLKINVGEGKFSLLLGGDGEKAGLERAMALWASGEIDGEGECLLDAIKVPHHGSGGSLSAVLCGACREHGKGVAAISVGTKFSAHPDREVLWEFLDKGWVVLPTAKRIGPRRKDFPLATGRRFADKGEMRYQLQDIHITWSPSKGLTWGPSQASVPPTDLPLYETAKHGIG